MCVCYVCVSCVYESVRDVSCLFESVCDQPLDILGYRGGEGLCAVCVCVMCPCVCCHVCVGVCVMCPV